MWCEKRGGQSGPQGLVISGMQLALFVGVAFFDMSPDVYNSKEGRQVSIKVTMPNSV